jgi:hypothetical protein
MDCALLGPMRKERVSVGGEMNRTFAIGVLACLGVLASTPATAAKPGSGGNSGPAACSTSDISITNAANAVSHASSCTGFFAGNLLNNKKSSTAAQTQDLQALGLTWSGDLTQVFEQVQSLNGAHDIVLPESIFGITYIAVHYGNATGGPGESTAFYVLNAAEGVNRIHLDYDGSSNLVVFATGIGLVSETPEPSSWAMMIGGFGMIGASMRRRRALSLN